MVKIKLSFLIRVFILAFAAVLVTRSFGVLALFQHKPVSAGVSVEKDFAKRIPYVKKDVSSDIRFDSAQDLRFPLVDRLEPPHERRIDNRTPLSCFLRSPPSAI